VNWDKDKYFIHSGLAAIKIVFTCTTDPKQTTPFGTAKDRLLMRKDHVNNNKIGETSPLNITSPEVQMIVELLPSW
jgi:hypothetical protein